MLLQSKKLLLLLFIFVLQACGGSEGKAKETAEGGGKSPKPLIEQELSFQISEAQNLRVNQTFSNQASGNGNGIVTYTSSNTSIATVDEFGLVNALAMGSVVISATIAADHEYKASSANYNISVQLNPQNIVFDEPNVISVSVGDTLNNFHTAPGSGSISYSSSDENIASVNQFGLVSVHTAGTTTITATKSQDNKYSATNASYQVVALRKNQSLGFSQDKSEFKLWANTTLNNPATHLGTGVINYSSSNNSVASVNNFGFVTIHTAGQATITASIASNNIYTSASQSYHIQANLNSQAIVFSKTGLIKLLIGEKLINIASGAGTGKVTYTSSNANIATVNANGVVTTLAEGSVTISAKIEADKIYDESITSYQIQTNLNSQSIVFAKTGLVELFIGEEFVNIASGAGSGKVTYTSSNTNIATVSTDGRVTVLAKGSATISASIDADKTYEESITSYRISAELNPQTITFTKQAPYSVMAGKTLLNAATGQGSGVIRYDSSNTNIATVDSAGLVTILTTGLVTITADISADNYFQGSTASYSFNAALNSQKITFSNAGPIQVKAGEFYLNLASAPGTGQITYKSSNPLVASVNNLGNVMILTSGSAIISANINSDNFYQSASSSYEINASLKERGVLVQKPGISEAYVGYPYFNLIYSPGTSQVVYTSSDSSIATVSSIGLVTIHAIGSVTISGSFSADELFKAGNASYTLNTALLPLKFKQYGPIEAYTEDTLNNPATGGGDGQVIYSSSDTNIATVDNLGTVTLIGNGSVTIHAQKMAHGLYLEDEASYIIHSTLKPLMFSQAGPLNTTTGNTISNPVIGGGTGDLRYTSSDNNIATVDYSGKITVLAPGSVIISAHITSDEQYDAASAHVTLNAINNSSILTAWVGKHNSEITFSDGVQGVEFYRASEENCALDNYAACQDGQLDILDDRSITDTALKLNQTAHARFNHGEIEKKMSLSANSFQFNNYQKFTKFKDKLWLIGGYNGQYKNQVWSSPDGENWTLVANETEFGNRVKHEVVSFNDKLWVIGGSGKTGYKNDVWSSSDGKSWSLKSSQTQFSGRVNHQLLSFNNKLWLFGGKDENQEQQNDIWSSQYGIYWSKVRGDNPFSNRNGYQVSVLNNKLWLIGGEQEGELMNDVWSSNNGSTWTLETEHAEFSGRKLHKVMSFNDKLWLIGGDDSNLKSDIWSSLDGVNWSLVTSDHKVKLSNPYHLANIKNKLWFISGTTNKNTNLWSSVDGNNWKRMNTSAGFSDRFVHQQVSFNNKLWVIGGYNGDFFNDIWSSFDGASWILETEHAEFSPRGGHKVFKFNDKLWLVGGKDDSLQDKNDIWSSTDGVTWTQELETTPFTSRNTHNVAVLNNKLWLVGGHKLKDVWSSDDALNWTMHTEDFDLNTQTTNHQLTSFNNKLWITGRNSTERFIWSSINGVNWNKVTTNLALPNHNQAQLVNFSNKMWLIGGYSSYLNTDTYIWSSADGENWQMETQSAEFPPRNGHAVSVFKGQLWLTGGSGNNVGGDVWRSLDGISWRKLYQMPVDLTD